MVSKTRRSSKMDNSIDNAASRRKHNDSSQKTSTTVEEEFRLVEEKARQETLARPTSALSEDNKKHSAKQILVPDSHRVEKQPDLDVVDIIIDRENIDGESSHNSEMVQKDKETTIIAAEQLNDKEKDSSETTDDDRDQRETLNGLELHQLSGKQEGGMKDRKDRRGKKPRNELTHLIPGYTAPRKLNASSLEHYRGDLSELQRRAERTDKSTKEFVIESTKNHVAAMQKTSNGFLPSSYTSAYASFKKGTKRQADTSAGAGWFGVQPTPMTDELKTDLAVIRNRSYLDPKRFYKSSDSYGKVVQLGTVIEGASEFYSSRLTKKERRSNLAEEIMADRTVADYAKNKYKSMQQEKTQQSKKRKFKPKRGKRPIL